MKKLLIAVCLVIVALGVMKFVEAVENITYDEFRDGVVDNLDNVGELRSLFEGVSEDELESLLKSNRIGMIDTIKTLLLNALDKNNTNLNAAIKIIIEKVAPLEEGKFITQINNSDKKISSYLAKIMIDEEEYQKSIDDFAQASAAIAK